MELLRPRVLVIDPDPSIRALLVAVARRRGFDADTAANREEALEQAHAWPYAAIIVEPRMPGGDALLRELELDKVIVATTATDPSRWKGVAAVLRKPFVVDELSSVIEQWSANA